MTAVNLTVDKLTGVTVVVFRQLLGARGVIVDNTLYFLFYLRLVK